MVMLNLNVSCHLIIYKQNSRLQKMKRKRQSRNYSFLHKPVSTPPPDNHPSTTNKASILNYKNGDTLELSDKNKNIFIETDKQFIKDIQSISNTRKNMFLQILNTGLPQMKLSDKICDELDFLARRHSKANSVNENSRKSFQSISKNDQCQCGCNRGKGKLLSLLTDQQKLTFLGPGVLLQFFFNKAAFVFLLFILAIYGVFGTVTNFTGGQAVLNEACQSDLYCQIKILGSDQNKQEKNYLYLAQQWLGLAFCVVWILSLRVLKYVGKQKNKVIDKKLNSSSDRAIKVSNLPRGTYEQTEVIAYFEELWKTKQKQAKKKESKKGDAYEEAYESNPTQNELGIKSIQIIYNVQFARKMVQKIFQLADEVNNHLQVGNTKKKERNCVKDYDKYTKAKENLLKTYQLLLDLRKRFLNDPSFRKLLSSTSCIIQFKRLSTQKTLLKYAGVEKTGIQKKIKMLIKRLLNFEQQSVLFKGSILKIERAPEPSDILWTNCEKPESLIRKLVILIITIVVMIFSFCIILGLDYLQSYIQKNPQIFKVGAIETIINIATSFALQMINSFLWSMMTYLLNIEYNHTQTEKIISQMNKVLVLTSINIIVLPIMSNYLSNSGAFIYGNRGLAGLAFDYHISSLIAVIKGLFNTVTMLKIGAIGVKFIRRIVIRFLVKDSNNVDLQQGDDSVNSFYEGPQFDIAQNYVTMITTILHAAFFCRLQPVLLLIVTFMILLFFFVNKIKLFRVCKIPDMTQYLVFDNAIYLLGFVPLYFGAGSIALSYFQSQINPEYPFMFLSPTIAMGLGLVGLFNPKDILNKVIKAIFKKCTCFDLELYIGGYEGEDADQETESEDSLASKNKDEKKQNNQNNREENYYRNSNMLGLFGFELTLKGDDENDVENQLKNYCQSFLSVGKKVDEVVEEVATVLIKSQFAREDKLKCNFIDNMFNNNKKWEEDSSKSLKVELDKENMPPLHEKRLH